MKQQDSAHHHAHAHGRHKGLRRGIPLLPSLFTTANIFFGYFAIISAMRRDFALAVICIFIAGLTDLLDGRIARLTGTGSEFGKQLDSLADVISFGVAPGIMIYCWAFSYLKEPYMRRMGWAASFLFVICGAIRLARFNVQPAHGDKRYFIGLPIPAGAGAAAALINLRPQRLTDPRGTVIITLIVLLLGLLMVSTLRYRSFKDVDLRSRKSAGMILVFAAFFALMAVSPHVTLFAAAFIYAASGPASRLYHAALRKTHPADIIEAAPLADGAKAKG